MDKKITRYYIVVLFCLMSLFLYSQGGIKEPPLPKPNGPGDGGYPQLPIDGGVSILLVLGTAFGIYKLKKKE